MTKKNLKPQQAAPVQREINTTSSECGTTGITPQYVGCIGDTPNDCAPFAGDDAE
ncbi:AcyP2 [Planktothrix agardhii]|uniref:anacyclamide/piricyclamide family prenylated cyclic peptide n=1 Tax=Planktothrix agardhii TaxID=1160 RepID=UPI001B9FE2B3|nr:anacyclamide/piricyclamide family prenylated cyclic peptide [Planktothrix agardhii]CAD0222640.1 AcyP2 [Planktothrix agardhii]